MKFFYPSLLSLLFLVLISACKKETINAIDFSKYTVTDSNCNVIGDADNTDWTNDTTWTTAETALMNFSDGIILVDTVIGWITISPICPNPNQGVFTMQVNTERECKMKVACVNTEMEMLYYRSVKLTGGPTPVIYDFSALSAFHGDMNYRMYYAFYNASDSLYYKGHGDFRIE